VWICIFSDNKVLELPTVCVPWQQWTETSVWLDDAGISGFCSSVVVDLWQSLSKWHLSLFWCAIARLSELELKNWQEWKRNQRDVSAGLQG
jgi:hypothetical protein